MTKAKASAYKFLSADFFWDVWCLASVVGVWPRFIEPNLLDITRLNLKLPGLPPVLKGLKLVQLSDLHFHRGVPDFFLKRMLRKVKALNPDMIVFTGDFICHSKLTDRERLKQFLNSFFAPFGCYAVLGNHDYAAPVSVNAAGDYDVVGEPGSSITRGFLRLFSEVALSGNTTEKAGSIGSHGELIDLIKETPFTLLENASMKIAVKGSYVNMCGLGEYTLGKSLPEQAFKGYDQHYPGIILSHNPDSVALLRDYPGDIILCGHTHGGQVNLPWIRNKLTLMENREFIKGLFRVDGKWMYVSRGLGSVMPFRWFARPEIVCITLE